MQNEKFAKKVLSVILEKEITQVALDQQETTHIDEEKKLTLFRLDFKATVKEPDGSLKTVLIELQKSKFMTDVQRFRNYLGTQYLKAEEEEEEDTIYPMVTIYILGYKLPGNPYLAVHSKQGLTDVATHEPVEIQDDFLKYLTHESYVVQVRRLPKERRTRIEQFFTLFNQAWCSEEKYILDLEEVPAEFSDVATYLQAPVLDAKFRKALELEDEVDRAFDRQEAKYQKKLAAAKVEVEEAKAREEEAKAEVEEARTREEVSRQKLVTTVLNLSKTMEPSEIAAVMSLTIEEVQQILLTEEK